jgi:tetratricopeptide (TPR) repeat protein
MEMTTSSQWQKIFWITLGVIFIYCLFVVPHYGITGDEVTQWKYGHWVWDYMKSFGSNKTMEIPKELIGKTYSYSQVFDSPLKYYGGFYDGIAAMLIDIFNPKDEFLVRHYWNLIFGFAGLIFGGLLAKEFAGWRAAFIAVIFMVFTPRFFGEIFNNPKDIPFATGYLAALLCTVKWLKALDTDTLNWKKTIWLGLSIALAISVRVGGILVIAYLGMFYLAEMYRIKGFGTKLFGKSMKHIIVAVVIGWIGSCLFWPYALDNIIGNPIEAVKKMSAYPLAIRSLYDGQLQSIATMIYDDAGKPIAGTFNLPSTYLLNWLGMGMPLFVLITFIGSFFYGYKYTKTKKNTYYLLLIFATVFPVFYIIYKKSVVYDGIRHILFVLPVMSILGALFFDYIIEMFSGKKAVQYAVVGITVILIALPARFMFANHPNEYIYFNELKGGIKGAYGNYETDYYFNSLKESFNWLKENKLKDFKPTPGHDSVLLASNIPDMMNQYINISGLPIKFVYVRYYQRGESDWDYGIFVSRFLDKEQLQNGYFPGAKPLHVVEADGVPLSTIQANDPERNMLKGQEATKVHNDTLAMQYFEKAVVYDSKDIEALRNFAIAAFQLGDKQKAIDAIGKAYNLSSLDIGTANYAGMIYLQSGDANKALQVFSKLTEDQPDMAEGWMGLGQAQATLRNYPAAIEDINTGLSKDSRFTPQGYMMLASIYQQMGDMQTAQKYANAAQQAGGGR